MYYSYLKKNDCDIQKSPIRIPLQYLKTETRK